MHLPSYFRLPGFVSHMLFRKQQTDYNFANILEEYDAELERMNAVMSAENQSLQYDNKQLNALIKDYETTLETVMDQFRNRAVRL